MGESSTNNRVERLLSGPIWKHLKVHVVSANERTSEIHMPVTEELKQTFGVLHGGIIATMMDMSMAATVIHSVSDEEIQSTLDLHVDYLRPMFGNTLISKAKVTKKGKRVVFVTADAFDENMEHIATSTGKFMISTRTKG